MNKKFILKFQIINSFAIDVLLYEVVYYYLITSKFSCNNYISYIVLITLFICFIIFTYSPPKIPLFKDPIDLTYGIYKNK